MPRGIPANKDSGNKATAVKAATKPAAQTTQPQKAATVIELSAPALDAIHKLEAFYKAQLGGRPMHGYAQPMRHGYQLRNTLGREVYGNHYLTMVASSRRDLFAVQPATIYVKGEALASTTAYDLVIESEQVVFTIDGKKHAFSFDVESDLYVDLSEYSGVLLAPVPEGVEKMIRAERATAQASGEEALAIYLTSERPELKVGDRIRQMLDDRRTFVVVDKHAQNHFDSRNSNDIFNDLTIIEVGVTYNPVDGALPTLTTNQPFRAYSGVFILAPTAE